MTSSTASPATSSENLLERKYARRFAMFDVDGNGHLEPEDFAQLADRLIAGLGADPDSAKAQRVRAGYQDLCSALVGEIDTDGDGRISQPEFLTGMARVAGDREGFARMIAPLARTNLDLCDTDGDGQLDRQEFARLLGLFNAAAMDDAGLIFDRLDTDGGGTLSVAEILDALCDFYLSTDPASPGNLLFGEI
ncbi:EF-hand domain-containing protein [Allokutzneria sp. NRRL B-24872]|uniref:EF-hand domain-containing protein n=1 Tax=Allokutzneria sp. NRRL B-24872 TaxID=1137961 RepID=UPI00143E0C66|nr:EF-hand domain-containing protein [Allokutzneria sp. NRRL B-24872]